VAAVAAAPDAGRLRIVVVLAAGKTNVEATAAGAALRRLAPAFRAEVARAVNRKRAPELVFDVRLESEVADV
jgi:hypothetical protein